MCGEGELLLSVAMSLFDRAVTFQHDDGTSHSQEGPGQIFIWNRPMDLEALQMCSFTCRLLRYFFLKFYKSCYMAVILYLLQVTGLCLCCGLEATPLFPTVCRQSSLKSHRAVTPRVALNE